MQSALPHQTQLQSILSKLAPAKFLSKDVSNLVLSTIKDYFDQTFLNIISEKIMSDINMLIPFMLNRIIGHIDNTGIVTE